MRESADQASEPTRSAVSGRSAPDAKVADMEGVLTETGGVGGVGEEVAVGTDGHGTDVHEGTCPRREG